MFLLLPLLEDGMGADGISDMTQSIIDDDICAYTKTILKALGITGTVKHRSREGNEYSLPKNPFSKAVIKLLPQDILADLTLADTFDGWLVDAAEINPALRQKVNEDIGSSWFEQTKKDKKESLLRALKEDDELFVEVLKALKEYTFEPYDVELDHRGVHRWLKDSEKFITESTPGLGQVEDSLEAINELVQEIISRFKDLIENKNMKGIFWANVRGTQKHVNEFYSQMLFFMVSKMWLSAQNSNVDVSYGKPVETDQFNIRFAISGSYVVLVQIKHANNTSLQSAFQKHLEYVQKELGLNSVVAVLNFKDQDTAQFTAVKEIRYENCSLIEIHAEQDLIEKKALGIPSDIEASDLIFELDDFKDAFIELEDFDWSFDENYKDEKRRGGQQHHRQTTEIKKELIQPMFSNRALIKGKSAKQRAERINDELVQVPTMSESEIELFSEKYGLKLLVLKNASPYFESDRKEQIYKWCLSLSKVGDNED